MFFLPLRFSYVLVEGPLEVFCISKINGKSLHGPVRGPNRTLNRTNIDKYIYPYIARARFKGKILRFGSIYIY